VLKNIIGTTKRRWEEEILIELTLQIPVVTIRTITPKIKKFYLLPT